MPRSASGSAQDEDLLPGVPGAVEHEAEDDECLRRAAYERDEKLTETTRHSPTPPESDSSLRISQPLALAARPTPPAVLVSSPPVAGDAQAISEHILRRKSGNMKRRVSDPAVGFFDSRDASAATHMRHDQASREVIRQLTGAVEVEEDLETIIRNARLRPRPRQQVSGRIYGHLRNYNNVESERLSRRVPPGRRLLPTGEAWQEPDIESTAAKIPRASSKRGSVSTTSVQVGASAAKEKLEMTDWIVTGAIGFLAISTVIIMCVWTQAGMLAEHGVGHLVSVKTRAGHMHAPLYSTPAVVALHGSETEFFEVRLIAMATKNFAAPDASHRRLSGRHWRASDTRLLSTAPSPVTGNITYQLYRCNRRFYERTIELRESDEVEHFMDIDAAELLKSGGTEDSTNPVQASASCSGDYFASVTATRSDGQPTAFMLQVLRMSSAGRHRQVIGIVIFIITFIGIVSEKIHRSYSAFLGASATLSALAAIQETPHLHTVVGMIDWGTLMLLFSMMILMRMLAVTGFFNWFALKVVVLSKQDAKVLFFALTLICGFLSMVLDNVTCVMLFGPLTFNLAKKMNLNPRPLYLSMTICATVGGTGTLIGDPPNIVIGSKMKIGFEEFLIYNLPLVVVAMLPLCSIILYFRTRHSLYLAGGPAPSLDLRVLERENRITDLPMFAKLCTVLFAILLSLLLSPVHKIEPAWFTCMGMFACAILFERHKLGKYFEFVEWDTLLFFALLFVLVESLTELGVIRMLGEWIIAFIEVFPEDSRMAIAVITILWVSSVGSAFLESLPYTATIVYILIDLRQKTIAGVNPEVLVWPLSVGACVGGIGSIMGSSANLVCMAVSERFADKEEEKVQGGDFLRFGLPTMLILTGVAMVWQLVLFVAADVSP